MQPNAPSVDGRPGRPTLVKFCSGQSGPGDLQMGHECLGILGSAGGQDRQRAALLMGLWALGLGKALGCFFVSV